MSEYPYVVLPVAGACQAASTHQTLCGHIRPKISTGPDPGVDADNNSFNESGICPRRTPLD